MRTFGEASSFVKWPNKMESVILPIPFTNDNAVNSFFVISNWGLMSNFFFFLQGLSSYVLIK